MHAVSFTFCEFLCSGSAETSEQELKLTSAVSLMSKLPKVTDFFNRRLISLIGSRAMRAKRSLVSLYMTRLNVKKHLYAMHAIFCVAESDLLADFMHQLFSQVKASKPLDGKAKLTLILQVFSF